jgi:hypothetical protein
MNQTLNSASNSRTTELRGFVIWLYIPAVACLLVTALVSYFGEIPIAHLTRDPSAITESSPLHGILSNIGVLLWCAAASICYFSCKLIRSARGTNEIFRFLFFGGTLTVILLLDDFFMLHDWFFPEYLNVYEKKVFAVYGILLLAYFVRFRRMIMETNFVLLLLALVFFALSILIDRLPQSFLPMHHIFEDGAKFLGIISWLGYFFNVSYASVNAACRKSGA